MLDPNPNTRIDWYDLFNHPALDEESDHTILSHNVNDLFKKLWAALP